MDSYFSKHDELFHKIIMNELNELKSNAEEKDTQLEFKKNELRKRTNELNELKIKSDEMDLQLKQKQNESKRLKDELNELETKFSENGSQSSAKEKKVQENLGRLPKRLTIRKPYVTVNPSNIDQKKTLASVHRLQLTQLESKLNQRDSQLGSREEELKKTNDKLQKDIRIARNETWGWSKDERR
ncbi:CMF_collapsed_G0013210.mRNA.1.CDS.1 [Saccharomyces cerevisiae]|nr:CMF_collapsed_G0013210.mRNA.1.CDS.1 [Saccharomyces cerevisiae]